MSLFSLNALHAIIIYHSVLFSWPLILLPFLRICLFGCFPVVLFYFYDLFQNTIEHMLENKLENAQKGMERKILWSTWLK